jgi:Domain of unknown function (DUF1707)
MTGDDAAASGAVPVPAGGVTGGAVPGNTVDLRVSDREREEMVTRLQVAFAEGRLDDEDFDTRVRAALAAKTRSQLDRLVTDLPHESAAPLMPRGSAPASAGAPGKFSLAYKTSLRRGGRWRVPEKFTAVSYKGGGTVIDLRAAELTSAATTIRAIAYKSRVQVLVPPGLRVEVSGIGVTNPEDEVHDAWPADAPVVRIRGIAYKGFVEIRTMPTGNSVRLEISVPDAGDQQDRGGDQT